MEYIFLHGLGQTAASWNKTLNRIGGTANVHCPELSDLLAGKTVTFANLYRAFSEYCAALPGTVALCGLSLGGMLALRYGIEHPEKVSAMVLIGTQPAIPKRLFGFQTFLFRLLPQRAFRQMGFGKSELLSLSASMTDFDFRRELETVSCPVLVVCGEKDRANQKAAEELYRKIPYAELRILKRAGHEGNIDSPEALGKVLREFFSGRCSGFPD